MTDNPHLTPLRQSEDADVALRPKTLAEFVGQAAAKDNKDAPATLKTKLEEFAKKAAPVNAQFGASIEEALATGNFERLTRSLRFRISGLKSGIMASTSRPTPSRAPRWGSLPCRACSARRSRDC